MWSARFRIRHDDWILPKTLKYHVWARGIPVNSYEKDGKFYHTGMIFLNGEKKDKERFIRSLHRDRRIKEVTAKGSQVYVLVEGEDTVTHAFDQSLFFLQPVLLKEGYEYWELGSWSREKLITFYSRVKQIAEVKMQRIRQEMPSVFIQHTIPRLTDRQRKALELAQEFGYYEYPRRISVEDLAIKAGIPRTTFQEHLRKAESKIMAVLLNPAD